MGSLLASALGNVIPVKDGGHRIGQRRWTVILLQQRPQLNLLVLWSRQGPSLMSLVETRHWAFTIHKSVTEYRLPLEGSVTLSKAAVIGWEQFWIGIRQEPSTASTWGHLWAWETLSLRSTWVVPLSICYLGLIVFVCQLSWDSKWDYVYWKHLA